MPKKAKELSAIAVGNLKANGRYMVGGADGLHLRIAGDSRSWILRAVVNGKRCDIGVGSYPGVTLATARKLANAQRDRIATGIDPLAAKREAREAARLERANVKTFEHCANIVIEQKTRDLKNAKHKAQWRSTLETYCTSIWDKPVREIEKAHVAAVLQPIWTTKNETADRLRGRIEAVLDYAKGMGYRTGDNPAQWKGTLQPILGDVKREAKPQPSLSHKQIGAFMSDLRKMASTSARALEFAILTATRSGETLGATWTEIDLEAREWTIPKERMKAKKEHTVPLSEAAVALLEALDRVVGNPYVFPGGKPKMPLSNMALNQLVRGMNGGTPTYVDWKTGEPIVPHGFRSTFRDWAGEESTYPREVIEHAMAHQLPDKAEAAYQRRTAMPKRVGLMAEWAAFCGSVRTNVVAMKAAS